MKHHIKIIFFMMFLSYNNLTSQITKNPNKIVKNNITKNIRINKVDSIFRSIKNNDSINFYYDQYASWLYSKKEFEKAISIRESLSNLEKIDTAFIQKNILLLGIYFNIYNKPLKAIKPLKKVFSYNNKNNYATNAYYQLGHSYLKIKDYHKALSYFKTTKYILTSQKKTNKLLIDTYTNLTYIYLNNNQNNYQLGVDNCKLADSLSLKVPIPNQTKFIIKLNLATLYNQYGFLDISQSFKYYAQCLEIAKQMNDNSKLIKSLTGLGILYNTTNYKKSKNYLNMALFQCDKNDTINLQKIHYAFALTYAREKKYLKSLNANKKSLKYLINIFDNDYRLNLINSPNKLSILKLFEKISEVNLEVYEKTKNKDFLEKSIKYFKLADYTIDLLKINSNEFKSKLFWKEKSANIYGKAIKACFLNNNFEDAFYFMEKNKALLLIEDITTQNYRLTLDVSNKLLEKETQYKKEIVLLENFVSNKKNKDSILKVKIDLERTLTTFQDSIYKGKKRLEKETKILTIKDVQEQLKQNEIFIEYHISKDDGYGIYTNNENGYTIFITKDDALFYEINDMTNFETKIKSYLNLLKKPLETKSEIKEFNKLSYQIFDKLFPDDKVRSLINNKKLTIVTDNILSFLPFESLITDKQTNDYLLKKASISYAYSKSFQHQNTVIKRNPTKEFLGFAPLQFNYDSLPNLSQTKDEVKKIKLLYKGKIYLKEKATKEAFSEESNHYNIIHLATHADANNKIAPWIAFKNKKLTLPELYTTKTQADLVVLSACNTSLGEIANGEGVLSLTRGFFYSGANTVVSSLWNVNDKTSTSIMKDFYTYLKDGKTKSEALRQAKLNYLDAHAQEDASPYYWSSFILIGDAGELATVPNNNFIYYIIGLILLLVLGIYFLQKNKVKKRKEHEVKF